MWGRNMIRIKCEECGKITVNGLLVKDKGMRTHIFCSEKCLDEYDKETTKEFNKIKDKGFLAWLFDY